MKKTLTLLVSILSFSLFAQAPQGLNYQATVRNSSGNLITNQNVYFRFNIMQNSATSVPVYTETHYVPTDDLGQVNCVIGQGTATTGTFSQIDWSNGTYFLGIELNIGSGYLAMGTTQFLSVPYALCAGSVSGNSLNLQQVTNNGNSADRVVINTNGSGDSNIRLNTTGGNTAGYIYFGINSWIQGTNGSNRAVQGVSNGINSSYNEGVLGFATNSTLQNIGTYGAGYGSTAQFNVGVRGESDSGVNAFGVEGYASNATDRNHGVGGWSTTPTTSALNIGIVGIAGKSENQNICLFGTDDSTSINGITYGVLSNVQSTSTYGTNYGVYGLAANAANNYAGFFDGNVTVTGTFVNPSDRKLKRDINPFTSALEKIEQLNPVTYYYDVEKNKSIHLPETKQYGFVAQDLENIFPDLVTNQVMVNPPGTSSKKEEKTILKPENVSEADVLTASDKDTVVVLNTNSEVKQDKVEFKGINYIGLISILTEGIKEQQTQIKALKAKNEDLEKRLLVIEALLKKQ